MSRAPIAVVFEGGVPGAVLDAASSRVLRTPGEVVAELAQQPSGARARWLTVDAARLTEVLLATGGHGSGRKRSPGLLVLERAVGSRPVAAGVEAGRQHVLRKYFDALEMLSPSPGLSREEIEEIYAAPHAADLALDATYDPVTRRIFLLLGDLQRLELPADALRAGAGGGPAPDLTSLRITDGGQTLAAGDFEASLDALLYEYSPLHRRKFRAARREQEQTLGASLRRLRLQKGLRQSDFATISAKEIARIERGEVAKPRRDTLRRLAARLGVPVDELGTY